MKLSFLETDELSFLETDELSFLETDETIIPRNWWNYHS